MRKADLKQENLGKEKEKEKEKDSKDSTAKDESDVNTIQFLFEKLLEEQLNGIKLQQNQDRGRHFVSQRNLVPGDQIFSSLVPLKSFFSLFFTIF